MESPVWGTGSTQRYTALEGGFNTFLEFHFMQPEDIKNKLIKELTGTCPTHKSGMYIGFFFSAGVLAFIGAGLYSWFSIINDNMPAAGGIVGCGIGAVLLGFILGAIGARMGLLDADIDRQALAALTRDEEDVIAEFGIKSWDYEERREREMQTFGFALATFQFLFGTLWSCFEYLFLPSKLPEEGLRGATAVIMFLKKSGRTDQNKLTNGLSGSGLPEQDTRRGLTFLKSRGLVVGNQEGFLLSKKGQELLESA